MDYKDMCVNRSVTIRESMEKIDRQKTKILFIVEDDHICGALTDGDIRRYLLKGGVLDDPAFNAANKNPKFAYSFEEAKRIYHEKNYIAIPVLNTQNKMVDIYIPGGNGKEKRYNLNIPVVINAGGKGTRLYPYTNILPKPLIPVGDLPILEHIMKRFIQFGCNKFHIIVNYKKEIMKAYFSSCERHYDITWYDEDKPLGTGGGLSLLKGKLDETFFFVTCDTLIESNFDNIFRFHKKNGNFITMVCAYKNLTLPYGIVEMGENGAVSKMKEKPTMSFLTNTGTYILEPELLEHIKFKTAISFPEILIAEKEKGENVAVYPISDNEWFDMGQLSELERMRSKLYGDQ